MNRAHLIALVCSTAIAASACSGSSPDGELFTGEQTPAPSGDTNEPTYTPPAYDDPPPTSNPDPSPPPPPSDAGPRDGAVAACDPKDRELEPNSTRLEANEMGTAYCGEVSATDTDYAKFVLSKTAKEIHFDYQSSGTVTFIVSVKGRTYTLFSGGGAVPLEPGLEYVVQVRTSLSASEKRAYRLNVDIK